MATRNKSIPSDWLFKIPNQIKIVHHRNKFIVIAPETANWIVLENKAQLQFFELLKEFPLCNALSLFDGNQDDAKYVVSQIVAKDLENLKINRCSHSRLQLFLTNACNLRCPHCYVYAGNSLTNELSTDEILHLLELFKQRGGQLLTLTGGEIRLRKDLEIIIKHAHVLGLKIHLLTNGTIWTENEINSISPYISQVQISIDGFSEKENTRVRGKGNFEKSLATVDSFIKNNVFTEVAITPFFDKNLHDKISEFALFGKMLLNKYSGQPFRVIYSGQLMDGREIKVNSEINKEYKEIIDKIYMECYGGGADQSFVAAMRNHNVLDNCAFGNLSVSPDGNVFLCGKITYLKPIGNIRENSYDSILEVARKAIRCSCIDNLQPCKNCELKYICGGDCRIEHFPEFRDADFLSLKPENIRARDCDNAKKEFFYNLMIDKNSDLYQ